MVVTITLINSKGTQRKISKFVNILPTKGRKSINQLAEKLEQKMKMKVRVWKGTLRSKIGTKVIDPNTIAIVTPFYAKFLEEGHVFRGRKFPFRYPPKLKAWMREKGIKHLGKVALPHPFIKPSIDELRGEIVPTALRNVKEGIGEAGFK